MTRLNGLAETVRCASYTESRRQVTTTNTNFKFTDLQESSSYTVTILAVFSATFEVMSARSNLEFITLDAGIIKNTYICMHCIIDFLF